MLRIHIRYWVAIARNRICYWVTLARIRTRVALTVWPYLAFWGAIILLFGGRKALAEAKARGKEIAESDPEYQRTVAETRRIEAETRRIEDEISALRHQDTQGDRL